MLFRSGKFNKRDANSPTQLNIFTQPCVQVRGGSKADLVLKEEQYVMRRRAECCTQVGLQLVAGHDVTCGWGILRGQWKPGEENIHHILHISKLLINKSGKALKGRKVKDKSSLMPSHSKQAFLI